MLTALVKFFCVGRHGQPYLATAEEFLEHEQSMELWIGILLNCRMPSILILGDHTGPGDIRLFETSSLSDKSLQPPTNALQPLTVAAKMDNLKFSWSLLIPAYL